MMKNIKGFTLLELLVVIGIIGILVAMGTVSYSSAQARSRDARRRADLQGIAQALEQYYSSATNTFVYPVNAACSGYEAYLNGPRLRDPKWDVDYATDNVHDGGNGSVCNVNGFCVCIEMEVEGTGNAYGRAGTSCTWTGTGDKNYYCVQNSQ